MDNVKISSLELENVKRVKAVQLEPTQDGLTVIGGRNAQGKTSVLDAIAWALGGDKMRPVSPNRDGALEPAHLHVELSNGIVVERGGKNGALNVTDSRGMKGGQRLLNEFIGQLALDLPKFLGGTDKQRVEYLLAILGVSDELDRIDRDYKTTYDKRRFVGRDADMKAKAAEVMPYYPEAPSEPVSIAALTEQLHEANATNADNRRARDGLSQMVTELARRHNEVDELTRKVAEMQRRLDETVASLDAYEAEVGTRKIYVGELTDVDTTHIEQAIADAEDINAKVRANAEKAAAQADAATYKGQRDDMTARLEGLKRERVKLLDDAGMPLPGLSVEDGTLAYNGHVWSDMSGAEQLRVATAIVRATKPECGFVLVDKLEQFDTQQLAEFAAWCEGEGLQVIGTRVATDDSCTVIIEDGMVVE